MALEHQTVRLPDGRAMGYALYGASDGSPLIACHGTPGCRLMLRMADRAATRAGLRIIAPDRPGYGLSSRSRRWRLTDWPDDVAVLADALGLARFALVGVSGGVPYALAAAFRLAARVRLVAVISGLAPVDQEEVLQDLDPRREALLRAARGGSLLLRAMLTLGGRGWRHLPAWMLRCAVRLAPAVERPALAGPRTQDALLASFREAFRSGSAGVRQDLYLFSRPWGFALEQIRVPAVLWHGEADAIVPAGMGRYLAHHLPDCTATFVPSAGHYWIIDHVETVLATLRTRLGSPDP